MFTVYTRDVQASDLTAIDSYSVRRSLQSLGVVYTELKRRGIGRLREFPHPAPLGGGGAPGMTQHQETSLHKTTPISIILIGVYIWFLRDVYDPIKYSNSVTITKQYRLRLQAT